MVTWLARITRRRLADEVARRLRQAILSGELRPGQKLREKELSVLLNVSRTPVREALRLLEQEALVVASGGRGVEVVRLDLADARDLYEIREVLDGLAARRAALAASADGLRALADNLEAAREALLKMDGMAFMELNVAFHESIAAQSGNPWLQKFIPVVRMTVQMFHPMLIRDVRRAWRALAEHERIYAALETGDSESAERSAREHVRNAKEALMRGLSQESGEQESGEQSMK